MSILKEVFAELFSMFVSDRWLVTAILALVAGVAAAIMLGHIDPLLGGAVLLAGCLLTVVFSVCRHARKVRRAAC